MDLARSRVKIGLEKPVRILHITDTHFSFSDQRDSEKTQEMTADFHVRHEVTPEGLTAHFREAVDYANECCDLLVHTGDFIFILAHRSLEKAREELERSKNYTMIAGNHEFSRFCGEAWEDKSYMMDNYHLVRTLLGNDLLFTSKVVGGINFVGIYNGFYQVEDWQTERLRREAAKGLPIVLFMHVPMFEQTLYDKTFEASQGICA